jgi:hypothetical protein
MGGRGLELLEKCLYPPEEDMEKKKEEGEEVPEDLSTTAYENLAEHNSPEEVAKLHSLSDLSDYFTSAIPHQEFSTAELQGYLLTWKMQPVGAALGIRAWVTSEKEERRRKKEAEEERLKKLKEAREKEQQERERPVVVNIGGQTFPGGGAMAPGSSNGGGGGGWFGGGGGLFGSRSPQSLPPVQMPGEMYSPSPIPLPLPPAGPLSMPPVKSRRRTGTATGGAAAGWGAPMPTENPFAQPFPPAQTGGYTGYGTPPQTDPLNTSPITAGDGIGAGAEGLGLGVPMVMPPLEPAPGHSQKSSISGSLKNLKDGVASMVGLI